MYNRYINAGGEDFFAPFAQDEQPFEKNCPPPDRDNCKTEEKNRLTFNADTIFLIVLVYFLVSDGSENEDTLETLLIVAALVFLGF